MSSGNVGSSIDQTSENICDRIQIGDKIKARAKQLAFAVVDAMPATCKKASMAGALYAACLEAHEPIGLKDICRIANGPTPKQIFHAKEFIRKELDLALELSKDTLYLVRFCTSLGLGFKDKEAAKEALANLQKIHLNNSPRLKAAAIAYLMHAIATGNSISVFGCDLFIEIGEVASLEPSTVRDFYKKVVFPRLSKIVPALNDMAEAATASTIETTAVAHDPTTANRDQQAKDGPTNCSS